MILPQTYGAALMVLILGMLCLGSWAAMFKSAKLRYELSYLDFVVGAVVFAGIYGLTFGNLGFDGFSLMDDLTHSGKKEWFYGFLAGLIFNFGNMLLMASTSISGLSVAFPIAFNIVVVLRHEAKAKTGKVKSTRRPTAAKPVVLAVVAGLLLGSYLPLI